MDRLQLKTLHIYSIHCEELLYFSKVSLRHRAAENLTNTNKDFLNRRQAISNSPSPLSYLFVPVPQTLASDKWMLQPSLCIPDMIKYLKADVLKFSLAEHCLMF